MAKSYADKGRIHREFQEGDQLWLRVKPRKSGLSLGACKKLSPIYCGPFRVVWSIGDIAYKLELPSHVHIHNVFHVSLLKPFMLDNFFCLCASIPIDETWTFEMVPKYLLDSREKTLRGRMIRDFLAKWKNYSIDDTSWVSEEELGKRFLKLVHLFLSLTYGSESGQLIF